MCHANNESGKGHLTDGMELPNQEKFETLGEKKTYKYLGILEADTIKQVEMKKNKKKKNKLGVSQENQRATRDRTI